MKVNIRPNIDRSLVPFSFSYLLFTLRLLTTLASCSITTLSLTTFHVPRQYLRDDASKPEHTRKKTEAHKKARFFFFSLISTTTHNKHLTFNTINIINMLAHHNVVQGDQGKKRRDRNHHHREKQMSHVPHTGVDYVRDTIRYCGISTPIENRQKIGIRGLVPAAYLPLELDTERCMEQMRSKETALEKYIYLQGILDVSERLYYAILTKYTAEVLPIVYTPTVGQACENFSHIYRGTLRGMYFSLEDAGMIREILDNWFTSQVTTIVMTDGERILGLGDLGVNGMGIPIGKLALYTACGGIDPAHVLPVHIDVGTNNETLLKDPYYLGIKRHRERGQAYDDLIAEFFEAAHDKFGQNVMIQFEDFGNVNAFRLLKQWKDRACTFNDDIQGTAAVALAGALASIRLTGKQLIDHTFLFAGAGEAGTGIAKLIAFAISKESHVSIEEARSKIFLVDSKGLVTKARLAELQHHKVKFAHDAEACPDLLSAVKYLKPSALIGVSAIPSLFTKEICEAMAHNNAHPIIFALSNPTCCAECTAQNAYEWTNGTAIFCSGSPFDPVELKDGRRFVPGQGNNVYIFPGVGLGVIAAGSRRITDHFMLLAAKTLASLVTDEQLSLGCVYPPLSEIRRVSKEIACKIAFLAHDRGLATKVMPEDMEEYVESLMYDPFADVFDCRRRAWDLTGA